MKVGDCLYTEGFDDGIKDMEEEEWSNKFGEIPCAVVGEQLKENKDGK